MKRVYLDYAAATPVDPRVVKAMESYFTEKFGNPGSLHSFGQEASAAVFKARQVIANELKCHYQDLVFTASATEANNLVLKGLIEAWYLTQRSNQMFGKEFKKAQPRIIVSSIEHESVYALSQDMASSHGVDVVFLPVDKKGVVRLADLKKAINENTVLVSVMYANNETGVIQPIKEIAKIVKEYRESHPVLAGKERNWWPFFHTDAVQAFQYLPCVPLELGVDFMTISSGKIYGPKGVAALYMSNPERIRPAQKTGDIFPLAPLVIGGGQEQGWRSGTENVPAIVGFAKAVELVGELREKEARRVTELRDYAWKGIKHLFPKAEINGEWNGERLPNNLNVYIPNTAGEQALVELDLAGIAVSSGSACTARSIDPSHVLLAMGCNESRAKNSLRITLGRPTTKQDIDIFLAAFQKTRRP